MSVPSNAPTRDEIVAAATDLVIERGYDKTTMRAIAERAGVSLGSAYYYFGGKEELIQGIYLRITDEHEAVARQRMDGVKDFGKRLELCVGAYLDVSSRYRTISDSLLALAIVPTSSLSPFSPASAPSRERTMALYRDVVEGSDLKTDRQLRPELPNALWLMHMGITLAWVHDKSPNQQLTRGVLDKSLPALDKLLRLGQVPLMRPFFKDAIAILKMLDGRGDHAGLVRA